MSALHPPRPGPPQVQISSDEVAVHNAAPAGPRDEDIQAALASVPVERPEIHRQVGAIDLPVADADQDHVALVSLHVLQVLDEERLFGVPREELLAGGIPTAQNVDFVFDAASLHVAEGRDAEGPARRLAGVLHHGQRDRLRLGGVDAPPLVGRLRVMPEEESGLGLAGIGGSERRPGDCRRTRGSTR